MDKRDARVWPPLLQAWPPTRPRARLLVVRRHLEEARIFSSAANQLNGDRQAVGVEAARHGDGRMASEVERVSVGVPGVAHGIDVLPFDLDRLEQPLVDRYGRARQRRREDHVEAPEPALHFAVEQRTR